MRELADMYDILVHVPVTQPEIVYIHLFVTHPHELEVWFPQLVPHLKDDGMLWISWQKKKATIFSALSENTVCDLCLSYGIVDVKVAVIDDVWSGLKFVKRKEHRGKWKIKF